VRLLEAFASLTAAFAAARFPTDEADDFFAGADVFPGDVFFAGVAFFAADWRAAAGLGAGVVERLAVAIGEP
jgi:hypothetical protein